LRIELLHDPKRGNWHYRVPALRIEGDATSLEAALRECHPVDADPSDADAAQAAETEVS